MQMVKIRVPERSDRAKSLVEMARRGRVVCLPDDVFIVPEPALELLQSLGVNYQELGRWGFAAKAYLACPPKSGPVASRPPRAFHGERDRARSLGLRDGLRHGLHDPDGQDVVAAAARDAVLPHQRLGRVEHRLAAEDQRLGAVLGEAD